jgi:hypothetical protein
VGFGSAVEPKVSKESKQMAYEKIAELRRRIVEDGDKFSTQAIGRSII